MKTTQNKLPKAQMEIEFELTPEEFQKHVDHALLHLKEHIKVDGFRPGQAPNKLVEDKINKESLLMEAGDIAVRETYSKYVLENKLEPVGQPEVSIIKIAQGSPFIFKTKITILPDVELPDYKEIAKKVKGQEISVTEQEIQDSINYLQKTRAKFTLKNEPAEKKDFVEIEYSCKEINDGKPTKDQFILGEGGFLPAGRPGMKGFEDNIVGMKAGEEKEFKIVFPDNSPRKDLAGRPWRASPLAGKERDFKVKMKSVQKMELPEINDEFAKELGVFDSSPFAKGERVDTLVALKQSMKEGITQEKEVAEKQRKRGEILEKISEKVKVELPDTLVDYEKQRLTDDLKYRINQNMKISFEQYLASVKQTEEDLKQTFQKEAEKRLKGFLILREIGKKENIEILDSEVEEEVAKSIKNYSKEQLGKIDIEQLKEYTRGVIYNEKVFEKLETFAK